MACSAGNDTPVRTSEDQREENVSEILAERNTFDGEPTCIC